MPTVLTKNCPGCRSILAAETIRCACGHQFALIGNESPHSTNLVVQAEALYESHLRARLQRAIRGARLAKMDLLQDPNDPVRRGKLSESEKEIKLLEAQLILQSARVADARAEAERRDTIGTGMTTEPSAAFRTAQIAKAEQVLDVARQQLAPEELAAQRAPTALRLVTVPADATSDLATTDKMVALRKR